MADSRSESLLVACLISCVFICHAVLPPEAEAQLAAARAACPVKIGPKTWRVHTGESPVYFTGARIKL